MPVLENVLIAGTSELSRKLWEGVMLNTDASVAGFLETRIGLVGRNFLGSQILACDSAGGLGVDAILAAGSDGERVGHLLPDGAPGILLVPIDDDDAVVSFLGEKLAPKTTPAAVEIPAESTVGIFGTGGGGAKVWEALMRFDSIEATWFSDNNAAKHGSEYLWLPVIAPDEIPIRTVDAVIVASMFRDEISKQLMELGLNPERIITPDVRLSVDSIHDDLLTTFPERSPR